MNDAAVRLDLSGKEEKEKANEERGKFFVPKGIFVRPRMDCGVRNALHSAIIRYKRR